VPISALVARVFQERRSFAFGIFRMGPGISGSIVPLVGWMIGMWGWRTAAVLSACILSIVGFPLAYAISRIAATEEGRQDSGGVRSGAPRNSAPPTDPQFTLGEALRTRAFWTLSSAMALRHMVTEGVSVHFVILLVDRGWSTESASSLLGLSALIGVPASIGMGWLGDVLDKRRLVMILLLILSVSVLIMGYAAHALAFGAFAITYSLAYGGLASLQEPIRADYFGTRAFATIQGMSRSVTTLGTFVGPLLAGYSYDVTNSYAAAFTIFAAVSLLATLLMFMTRAPGRP
jgi:MFS family permease